MNILDPIYFVSLQLVKSMKKVRLIVVVLLFCFKIADIIRIVGVFLAGLNWLDWLNWSEQAPPLTPPGGGGGGGGERDYTWANYKVQFANNE